MDFNDLTVEQINDLIRHGRKPSLPPPVPMRFTQYPSDLPAAERLQLAGTFIHLAFDRPARRVRVKRRDGLVQERPNRETGTTVAIYDLDAPEPFIERGDGQGTAADREPRWLTLCVDHSRLRTHYTRTDALSHASMPSGWCGVCAGTEPLDED